MNDRFQCYQDNLHIVKATLLDPRYKDLRMDKESYVYKRAKEERTEELREIKKELKISDVSAIKVEDKSKKFKKHVTE